MTMTILWTGMVVLSILCGLATGQSAQVTAAAVEGTQAAVELCLSIAGMLCLWTGVMEVMRRSGLAEKLSRLLRPMLRLLFPQVARDRETWTASRPMCRPICWGWATLPPLWGWRPPGG